MSSDNSLERLWRVQSTVNKLVLDNKRDADRVADLLQTVIDKKSMFSLRHKFALMLDLGILTVPADYDHATALAKFRRYYHKEFSYYEESINDMNFSNPSNILLPGKRIRIKVFKQITSGTTTSEERMIFLKNQNAFYTGAQGASLVFAKMRDKLPKGYYYVSFDEPHTFLERGIGLARFHGVPYVHHYSNGVFFWGLDDFEGWWTRDRTFLGFFEE